MFCVHNTTSVEEGFNENLSSKHRFIAASKCKKMQRPPVWLMRQAGRCLPEYRLLKKRYSFLDLVRTPELAAAITIQPLHRFDFDAAIIFSDILVLAEAMGLSYRFIEGGGVLMDKRLENLEQIKCLDVTLVNERLAYVSEAIQLVRRYMKDEKALIGFAGSPWTLANFMLEGGSSSAVTRAWWLYQNEPLIYQRLIEKLVQATVCFLKLQINSGVNVIQIFDSLAELIPTDKYMDVSGKWINYILRQMPHTTSIVFVKGTRYFLSSLSSLEANVLGIDASIQLRDVAEKLRKDVAVQGNLDPGLLLSSPIAVETATRRLINSMQGRPGYIFNLGHGVPANAKIECIKALVNAVMQHNDGDQDNS